MLDSFTDHTFIFTVGSKYVDKTAAAFLSILWVLKTFTSSFTAELKVNVSALRFIKSTKNSNTLIIFSDSKSALQALLSKWVHPTVNCFMRCLVFIPVMFCWLPSHMGITGNERADSVAKASLQKGVSEYLISYTDAYQYIGQYVRDLWLSE